MHTHAHKHKHIIIRGFLDGELWYHFHVKSEKRFASEIWATQEYKNIAYALCYREDSIKILFEFFFLWILRMDEVKPEPAIARSLNSHPAFAWPDLPNSSETISSTKSSKRPTRKSPRMFSDKVIVQNHCSDSPWWCLPPKTVTSFMDDPFVIISPRCDAKCI